MKKDAGMVKLGWNADALYGLVTVSDLKIEIDESAPWNADCIELWLETDCARAEEMGEHSVQLALVPSQVAGNGKAIVFQGGGSAISPEAVTAAWRPIDGGYAIEFSIPARQFQPAKLEAGTKFDGLVGIDGHAHSLRWGAERFGR